MASPILTRFAPYREKTRKKQGILIGLRWGSLKAKPVRGDMKQTQTKMSSPLPTWIMESFSNYPDSMHRWPIYAWFAFLGCCEVFLLTFSAEKIKASKCPTTWLLYHKLPSPKNVTANNSNCKWQFSDLCQVEKLILPNGTEIQVNLLKLGIQFLLFWITALCVCTDAHVAQVYSG